MSGVLSLPSQYVEEALHGTAEVPRQVVERIHALQTRLDAPQIPARFASDLAVPIREANFKGSVQARLAQLI